jgi:hypothetical protein
MAAYDVRVQVATDDNRPFNLYMFQRALAQFADTHYGITVVWVDGQKYDPKYNSFDGEWDAGEGDCRFEMEEEDEDG